MHVQRQLKIKCNQTLQAIYELCSSTDNCRTQ